MMGSMMSVQRVHWCTTRLSIGGCSLGMHFRNNIHALMLVTIYNTRSYICYRGIMCSRCNARAFTQYCYDVGIYRFRLGLVSWLACRSGKASLQICGTGGILVDFEVEIVTEWEEARRKFWLKFCRFSIIREDRIYNYRSGCYFRKIAKLVS